MFGQRFQFIWQMPRNAIAGSHGMIMYSFVGTDTLTSKVTVPFCIPAQKWIREPIFHILTSIGVFFVVFWILAFLIGVLSVIIVLIYNSLISDGDVEMFFLYTYFPSVYLLSEVSVKVFGRFKLFLYCCVWRVFCIFDTGSPY